MTTEHDFSQAQHEVASEPSGKSFVSFYLDDEILAVLQARAEAEGKSWQALISEVLRSVLNLELAPISASGDAGAVEAGCESLKAADLQRSYWRYWGKAQKESGLGPEYHLLPYHCLDVAAVGGIVWLCKWRQGKI